jgi:translation initiation factor IF-2
MGSLASVKSELFTRKQEMKTAHPAPPTHKPAPRPEPRRDIPSTSAPRPGVSVPSKPHAAPEKKPFRPAPIAESAPAVSAPPRPVTPIEPPKPKRLEIQAPITVKELSEKIFVRSSELIQKLIKNGIFANINQSINFDMAKKVAIEFNYELVEPVKETGSTATEQVRQQPKDTKNLVPRAPIVTFMGHVDHGKTSLLDAIRKTKVTASEAGGITQHIGAYEVFLEKGAVTFLDTPGHEAFTAMRARGASVTDVVVLVVAADDGVMPQTIEAIDHAKAAGVPIVVAINKIDLPSANPDRVKKALMEHELMTEEWGGKTIMKGVSAKTGQGIDDLLEMLVLESDLLELRANPTVPAKGVVIEAELSKGGVLATVLVQDGTLRVGDVTIVGNSHCKIRAMINDRGQRIKEALPSMPVEILGLDVVPKAGDLFYVVKDEKTAKDIIEQKQKEERPAIMHMTLEHLSEGVKSGNKVEELKLILKSDVQGSVEALRATLGKIQSKNVRLNIIHVGIGDVTESDVMLAAASDAVFRQVLAELRNHLVEVDLHGRHHYGAAFLEHARLCHEWQGDLRHLSRHPE